MNPAKLDRRIIIQRKENVTDDEGISTLGWVDYITVWASHRALTGREYFAAAAVNAENTVGYEIRRRQDITAAMRLKDRDRTLEIVSVIDDPFGDRSQTRLMCKEVGLDG